MDTPKFLILSGMHGNEHEVIAVVTTYLKNHHLPNYLSIPQVSPSAISRETRTNAFGHDVNRSFYIPAPDKEIAHILHMLENKFFDLTLDFHEDPDRTREFYMYDTGHLTADQHTAYRKAIESTGAVLYNGVDDSEDVTLGYTIHNGYISTPIATKQPDTGFSSGFLLRHNISKRYMTLEIPGKAPIELKRKLVAVIFDTIPMFL